MEFWKLNFAHPRSKHHICLSAKIDFAQILVEN